MSTLFKWLLTTALCGALLACEGGGLELPLPSAEGPWERPPVPAAPAPTREWHVSPTGSDTAAGSAAAPLRTLTRALTLVRPGEAIRVAPGTYAERLIIGGSVRAGTASAPIVLKGEGKPRLVPVGSAWSMVEVQRPHWRLEGLEFDVRGEAKVAVAFSGDTEGSMLVGSELHHGSAGSGVTTYGNARGVTLEGNHIHHFERGEVDSHGIVIQPSSRDITVRGNDIHDNSGDSVQCIGPEGYSTLPPAESVLIEDNHLHDNRENAVDIKTCHRVTVRNNRMHGFQRSSTSRGEAVVTHMSARHVVIEANDIADAALGIAVGGNREGPPPTDVSVRRNLIRDLATPEGSAIRIENCDNVRVLHNTVLGTAGFALVVGHGTGGASSNVAVRNNLFGVPYAVNAGHEAPGLSMDSNLYLPGASFWEGSMFVPAPGWRGEGLAAWQARGRDARSFESGAGLRDASTLRPGSGAVDRGMDLGLPYCGRAPDVGALEEGCR